MGLIRAKTGHRLLFTASVLVFAVLTLHVFRTEAQKEWVDYQREFRNMYEQKVREKMADPNIGADPVELAKWEKELREARAERPHLRRVFLPEAGVRDLCTSCHLGIDNPLFADAPEPFRSHPGNMLESHPGEKYGCTMCHGGRGTGTTTHAAHGLEESWLNPLIPEKYIKSTCIGCHETSYGLEGAEAMEIGRLAFAKYGCYGCHDSVGFEDLPKFGPPFDGFKDKLSGERWMLSWLRAPEKMRSDTLMPAFQLSDEEIRDVTAFVLSLESGKEYPEADLSTASAEEGEALFTDLGCKACHSPKREETSVSRRVPNLSDAGTKLNPDWIFEYLDDPRGHNPETRMPKLNITEADRKNLTAYLMTLKGNDELVQAEKLSLDGASLENGEKLTQLQGCYGCHAVKAFDKAPNPGVEVAEVAHKELEDLPFGNSKVKNTKWDWILKKIEDPKIYETEDTPLKMPKYQFDEGELDSLTTFYLHNERLPLPQKYMSAASQSQLEGQAGEWIVTENNCQGCHMFKEDVKPRIDQFIGLKTYVPPRLVGEGEKVQPQWAFQYLSNPNQMRPWLNMRMPNFSFTYEQVEALIDYFAAVAESPEDARTPYVHLPRREDLVDIEVEMGEYRVVSDKCMQCHPISMDEELPADVKLEDLSINLMLSKTRLRPEWIKNFLRDPDKYAGAGTKMPYVFYTPDGAPKVSDAEMWIDYITNYLMVMEEVPQAPAEEAEAAEEEEFDWSSY
jgi:mono/diheme cytochrome c family protein